MSANHPGDGFDPGAALDLPDLPVNSKPIGIFDSGLGGLTVARAIASRLPAEAIYYVGDTKRCPYGTREQSEVRLFVRQVGRWLENHDVKLVVIACNTATAAGLDVIQRALSVPVIGVIEPGARAAIQATRTRRVGVLATSGTVASGAYARAIHNLDAGVRVTQAAAGSFVDYVERELASGTHLHEDWMESRGVFDTPEVRELAARNVEPLLGRGIDTVVLGCTHFPLLARENLGHLAGRLLGAGGEPKYRFATTSDDITSFAVAGKFIFGHPIDSVEHIDLDTLGALADDPVEYPRLFRSRVVGMASSRLLAMRLPVRSPTREVAPARVAWRARPSAACAPTQRLAPWQSTPQRKETHD